MDEDHGKKHLLKSLSLYWGGKAFNLFKYWQELGRLFAFSTKADVKRLKIAREIIGYSKRLIGYFALLIGILIYGDKLSSWLVNLLRQNERIQAIFAIPPTDFFKSNLEVLIAFLVTLVAIVFSLYIVGFQSATARYSDKVTEYINQDRPGNWFFGLNVFSIIFASYTLLKLEFTETIPYLSFLLSWGLALLSIRGVIIFKDHYLNSFRSAYVFERLAEDVRDNVKNARLDSAASKSWSIVQTGQKSSSRALGTAKALIDDLLRGKYLDDAQRGILHLATSLTEYTKARQYINADFTWWFTERMEQVKGYDSSMYPLKANYEMQGLAPLGIGKTYYTWFEDKVLDYLKEYAQLPPAEHSPLQQRGLTDALIEAYRLILAGDYTEQREGQMKTLRGSYENQDFYTFDIVFNRFISLSGNIDDDDLFADYLNALGDVRTVIVDGFWLRSFPGTLIDWRVGVNSTIDRLFAAGNGQLAMTRDEVNKLDLPRFSQQTILDYYDRLAAEQYAEGRVITPREAMRKEILAIISSKEEKLTDKYLTQIYSHLNSLMAGEPDGSRKISSYLVLAYFGFNQLIHQEKWERAKKVVETNKQLLAQLLRISKEQLVEDELREPVEKALFRSLINRNKPLYRYFLHTFILILITLRTGEKDTDTLLKLTRIPLLIGGLSYLISELDQDPYYVTEFIKIAEGGLYPPGTFIPLLDALSGLRGGIGFSNILEESTRYRWYFRDVINRIGSLPKTYSGGGDPNDFFSEIGVSEVANHPSAFIRDISRYDFSDMDECTEGFTEWVKKREEIKKLVNTLAMAAKSKEVVDNA